MAKKNYVKLDAGNIDIRSKNSDSFEIKISGVNKAGTPVEVSITADDWYMPRIIGHIATIGRKRVESAQSIHNRILNAINP